MKKITSTIVAIALAASGAILTTPAASAADIGGWSEGSGAFYQPQALTTVAADPIVAQTFAARTLAAAAAATPRHTGKAETKVINGTTHKRAHGWTTWAGTYHYTTARLEHTWPNSGVIATSGRKWGTGGTEAVTGWVAFNPNLPSSGHGSARTYYGK